MQTAAIESRSVDGHRHHITPKTSGRRLRCAASTKARARRCRTPRLSCASGYGQRVTRPKIPIGLSSRCGTPYWLTRPNTGLITERQGAGMTDNELILTLLLAASLMSWWMERYRGER